MKNTHTFHIPVMGIAFTVDSAMKVARYGMDSVMALSGQPLQEKLKIFYSEQYGLEYEEITEKSEDYRARRTTEYLNLLDKLIKQTFEDYKNSPTENRDEIEKYLDMLPDAISLKKQFYDLMLEPINPEKVGNWVEKNIVPGSIDVNIMTKLDRENYSKGEKLPAEQNDAHAALRGYANSTVSSSLVLSAGLNPRLFTYMEQFEDFYPDTNGNIKKKIILKVSDYRSALVQGRFLAKKGLWISEYRIESGLNCGGHAFATDGYLMGPILAEFKKNKDELFDSVFEVLNTALEGKNRPVAKEQLPLKFTAQGGVGTSEEHQFLLDEYELGSVGWGSPFLLVPEATNVDAPTIDKLIEAKEDDFYLSKISPLGVPFNSLRGTSKEQERLDRIAAGKPGSPCIEGNLALFNKEFSEKPLCTASRQYQSKKIKELDKEGLDSKDYEKKYNEIVEKTCLCTGLVTSVLIKNGLETIAGNDGASICPGPNMLYFKKVMTLNEMTNHIYGKEKLSFETHRPHMFIKELYAYLKYLNGSIEDARKSITKKAHKRLIGFSDNLMEGIDYYYSLFNDNMEAFKSSKSIIISELDTSTARLQAMQKEIMALNIEEPVKKV